MGGAIITSAKYRSALAATRCLGKHGIKVACGDEKKAKYSFFPSAFYSKYCHARFTYPSYADSPAKFIEAIIDFANSHRDYSVLIPMDAETFVVSQYEEMLRIKAPHLAVPVHEYSYICVANDKRKIQALATKLGIPTPRTFAVDSLADLEEIAKETAYPAVIKLTAAKGSQGFNIVHNREELLRQYSNTVTKYRLSESSEFPLVQEYIPGTGYGVSCIFYRGALRAKFTHRRLRETSASGGPSVSRISDCHPEMEDYAVRLLNELKWHGVAMVEFKLDQRGNKPKLLEINPRFWGSLHLAISAGIEFPYLLYQMALNGDFNPVTSYRVGTRARFMWGDIQAFPSNLLGANSKVKFLKDFFDFRNDTYDDLSLEDPLPAMVQVLNPMARVLATGHIKGE